jgi:hypothetical protein
VGGVLVVELPLLPCLLIVVALAVGAILIASRHPAPAVGRLIGVRGVVTSVIPLGGFGEIRARVGERSLRLRARAEESLALGTEVVVAAQLDESTVLVRPQPPRLTR